MSKSKKNTIDPETMINQYGADAVRWFILSDSPPEKDVQWSDTGVAASNKFLQKIWNLNVIIKNRTEKDEDLIVRKKFVMKIDNFINKIDNSIENFRFNVSIAHFHEVYKILKDYVEQDISNKVLVNNLSKIMKLMMPFTPYLANECLEAIGCESTTIWPKTESNSNIEEIKLPVQVNGKTRDIMLVKKDTDQESVNELVQKVSKANKYIANKEIIKIIYVKNRIINYIIKV